MFVLVCPCRYHIISAGESYRYMLPEADLEGGGGGVCWESDPFFTFSP